MSDDEFDRTELVLILSNVVRSMKYLKDSSTALSSVMGKITSESKRKTRDILSVVLSFTRILTSMGQPKILISSHLVRTDRHTDKRTHYNVPEF